MGFFSGLTPFIKPALTLGTTALAGPAGGALSGALTGAAVGAGGAALTGGDIGTGALVGGAGGGLAGGTGLLSNAPIDPNSPSAALQGVEGLSGGVSAAGFANPSLTQAGFEQGLNVAPQTAGDVFTSNAANLQSLLPSPSPGFKQSFQAGAEKVGLGLVDNADSLIPLAQQPQVRPLSGPSLAGGQAQASQNPFVQFSRRRR